MLQIGVIGLGSMGKNHARVCSEINTIRLAGISDIDITTVNALSDRFHTKSYQNHKEMLQEIDAAIIATPTNTHYKIAMDLLDQGKHVLVEKPICETVQKADEMVKKAKKEDLILAVGHIERYNPVVRFIKESLDSKKLGELISLASKRVSSFPGRIKDVGVVFDFGIHDIDVMRYIAGEVTSVYARAGSFNKNITHEDHANLIVNFESGVSGTIEVNWLTPVKIRKLFLTCSESFVEADYIDQSITMSSSSFRNIDEMNLYNVPIQYNINNISLEKKEPLRNEIMDFIQAVEHKTKPLVTGEDGLQALKIAEAATKSYKTGKEVKIE
ncbi:MAG: Gfo/Idh/MocA family oxidoreductase [Candidatus Thermoplasmatota archaeon]|jgi:UDP-N-acetylglucosamine 3-dehydrogenase|nr:Gfo/Idh/MocA family oxidoreductase [Candidatus Thermoplasmatota archaeon]